MLRARRLAWVSLRARRECGERVGELGHVRDLARFGHLMLNDGAVDGFRVTPPAWATRHRSRSTALMDGDFRAAYPTGYYRAKWWCTGDELGTFYGVGIYGQYVWIVPRAGLVLAKLSSLPKALEPAVTRDHHVAFRRLVDSLA